MKLKIITTTLLFFLLKTTLVLGQDIHYTQFNWVPMLVNPAMSGSLSDADMQYGAIYRDQGFTVTPQAYNSFSLFADSKFQKGFRSRDFMGMGLMVLHDQAGTGALTTNEVRLNLAYHLPLSDKHILSFGGQGSLTQRSYGNFSAFSFEEELNGSVFSESLQNDNRQYVDGHGGIMLKSEFSETSNFQIGGSVYHLNNKNDALNLSTIDKFTLRYSGFAIFNQQLNDRVDLEPRIQYQNTKSSNELVGQMMLGFLISEYYNTNVKIKCGGGIRMNDSWQLLLGAEYGNWEIGFGFDSNVSGLAKASGFVSGVELGIKYRHKRPEKKEKPKPVIKEIEPIQIELALFEKNELDSVRISISEEITIIEDSINSNYPYERDLLEGKKYSILVEKPGYIPATTSFTTSGIKTDSIIEKIVELKLIPIVVTPPEPPVVVEVPISEETPEPIIEEPTVEKPVVVEEIPSPPVEEKVVITTPPIKEPIPVESGERIIYREEAIVLKHILYDFDDDKILGKAEKDLYQLLKLLQTYPDMIIELSSHTDARGSDEYNKMLSRWRAQSARKWLLKKGIADHRIIAKGYGETQIKNQCFNGVDCTDKEHRENRRTEFKIIGGPTSVRYRIE